MAEVLHFLLRGTHIAIGAIGLVLFWIPVFAPKGGQVHRLAGRWFVATVYVVAVSGIVSSFWALVSPASFLNIADPSPDLVANVHFLFSILAFLAILALQGAVLGMRVVRIKDGGERLLNLPLRIVFGLQLLASVALAFYAVIALNQSGTQPKLYIPLVLAIVGLFDLAQQFRFTIQPRPRGSWLIKHLECMIGCGIAFYTAAMVTLFNRYVGTQSGVATLIPWLLPTIVGTIAIYLLKRRLSGVEELAGIAQVP
jgi:hypothetical protein